MAESSTVSPEVRKILEAIEVLIIRRRIKRREFERRIKVSGGSLSRMVSGKLVLKVETLFEMLKVLEVDPFSFFNAVFAGGGSSDRAQDLFREVQSVPLPQPQAAISLTREEIKKLVEEALLQHLDGSGTSKTPKPSKSRRQPKKRPRQEEP